MTAGTASEKTNQRAGVLAPLAFVLAAIGFALSVYLTELYVEVTEALRTGVELDKVCSVSETVNCVTVAMSEYSAFLGIPIAVWGLEYFGIAMVAALAAMLKLRLRSLKHWDSLLFVLSCIGVPVTIVLGCISAWVIHSICIMCFGVYAVNTGMVLVFAIPNRKRLLRFAWEGPKEIFELVSQRDGRTVVAIVLAILALSQLAWLPPYFERTLPLPTVWGTQPVHRNTLGPPDAPIRIEEFTDFQCPFCGTAHAVLLEVVERNPGKIHLIHRDFPLDHNCNPALKEPFHPDACAAAYFARCAAEQDMFWPFETYLFHNQNKLKRASLLEYADKVGLNRAQLLKCVESDATRESVIADIEEGTARQVMGTPAFFINGEMVVGAKPIEFWEEKIGQLLPKRSADGSDGADGADGADATDRADRPEAAD